MKLSWLNVAFNLSKFNLKNSLPFIGIQKDNLRLQFILTLIGITLLALGLNHEASAYTPVARYNDDRIAESVDIILTYINGTFGALVMVSAGIAAILSSAFGQYRAALGLLVVAVGSFILRSLISTWFNDENLQSP